MMVLGKKELLYGFLIGIIVFICMTISFRMNHKEVYYQVIFDSTGGSEVAGQNVLIGSAIKKPSETTKEGFTFKGWYLDDELFDLSTRIRKDITLKAKWEQIKKDNNQKTEEDVKKEENQEEKKEEKKEETSQPKTNNEKKSNTDNSQTTVITPQQPVIVDVSSVTLNLSNLSLKVGENASLVANIQPANATNKNVTWTSSNYGVVTVTNGNINAVGAGTAVVTANVGGKTASCTITVTKTLTYNSEIVDIPSSAIGQCYIYIKNSDGQRVNGTITIYYINGTSETVQVTSSGVMKVRSTIASVSIVSAG